VLQVLGKLPELNSSLKKHQKGKDQKKAGRGLWHDGELISVLVATDITCRSDKYGVDFECVFSRIRPWCVESVRYAKELSTVETFDDRRCGRCTACSIGKADAAIAVPEEHAIDDVQVGRCVVERKCQVGNLILLENIAIWFEVGIDNCR